MTPPQILMIDDDPEEITLVEWAFQKLEIQIDLVAFDNGADALKYLLKQDSYKDAITPDLVFLDLNIPAMKGTEILHAIRSFEQIKLLPVIIFSTSSNPNDIQECYQLHANSFISKPSTGSELCNVMQDIYRYWFLTASRCKNNDETAYPLQLLQQG